MNAASTNNGPKIQLIGEVLEDAGLISEAQLQTALFDQQIYSDLKFGEILTLRGWIRQPTADFFAKYAKQELILIDSKRLGDYLLEADLLTTEQLALILDEQRLNHMLFGSLAVLKGYIPQKTLNFFLRRILNQHVGDRRFWQTTHHPKTSLAQQPNAKATQPPLSKETLNTAKETDPTEINWIG
ncbi:MULTISPECIES: hypothetical protein [Cyanophyceae]|uniref:Uncharacterized protein SYNPCC7002_A1588 n=1 Tax=Picosynechococcus sp. (strain ATCC 27264 / PCC 7002 / PR-6) TaxID=32049 RepID=Y1588_PICP2|nr:MULTISPECIES: hypothetical protein [Cyanophyceae]P31526.1 RecName: Full=Uncharacterized protein SYNPCC7002_A1588 [Picosynechococcus sp. PCC 7002]pir/JS0696/ hypothetical 20.9K protein (psaC region) - Synechococcus sp. (PCC 7002) [Synechococcus sp.]ACA99579.1 conserved hypothetical protein [Picosynechococcus sp. PCC 7002]ANV87431.1 hypothetical protein AWQ22_08175 [Picosynechococcus sp. PCC 7117]QCS50133.1 hypothetical protein FEK30_12235 [Picosynechococcus sp. PCC 11901]SMH29437.1 hypothet